MLFLAMVAGGLIMLLGTLRMLIAEQRWAGAVLWAATTTLNPGFGDEETPALVGVAVIRLIN